MQAPIRTRSWLFTPATRQERFANASRVGADVAILDLEDAVAPGDKVRARTTALNYLAENHRDRGLHALRINGLDTRPGISDLEVLLASDAVPDFRRQLRFIQTDFVCVTVSRVSRHLSRPVPDCLNPPQGCVMSPWS